MKEASSHSYDDRLIPGMIDTSGSGRSSIELTTVNALIASLHADLIYVNSTWPRDRGRGRGQGRGWTLHVTRDESL